MRKDLLKRRENTRGVEFAALQPAHEPNFAELDFFLLDTAECICFVLT